MVCDTWPTEDASTHQIWNSCLKEYRSYVPDSMAILETRSEVKVTVTWKWNGTIRHSKMHSHTKFGIPPSNNKRDMLQIYLFKKEVKVTVTCKWYTTLHHPKMHPYTKFGIPISNNLRDMFWTWIQTRSEVKVKVTQKWYLTPTIQNGIHTPNLEFLPSII